MKVNKELFKGSTTILILSLLDRQSMYGYQMIREIEKRSSGVFKFKEGTLYPILHSLESDGLVDSYWDESNGERKRKYYKITDKGKRQFKEKQQEWTIFRSAIDQVLWEGIVWG
jgi:PadR family transcriptional regulator, regulatory protein PadR